MRKIFKFCIICIFSLPVYGQKVKDSYQATDKLRINTYETMGYVFDGYVKYFIDGDDVSVGYNIEPLHTIDSLDVIDGFVYRGHHYSVTKVKRSGFDGVLHFRKINLQQVL